MYCSSVVKGRGRPTREQTVGRRQQYATPAATAGGGGIPGDERRHDRSAQALHLSWIGTTRRCRRSPDSQVERSHPAFPGRWAQWRRGVRAPGHSGEDRVGLAPTSRFCIAVASVAADHEAVQRDVVDDARHLGEPQGRVGRAGEERVEPQEDLAAASRRERRAGALVQAHRERGGADAGHRGAGDPGPRADCRRPSHGARRQRGSARPRPGERVDVDHARLGGVRVLAGVRSACALCGKHVAHVARRDRTAHGARAWSIRSART